MSDEQQSKLTGYATQLALALLLSTLGWLSATVSSHVGRIAVVEARAGSLEHQFERIEEKLDRALKGKR
jgi:hypothetical protein